MRSLICLALLGTSLVLLTSPVWAVEEEVTLAFIQCVNKSLNGGLESADIPDHDPLIFHKNLSIPLDAAGISGVIEVNNAAIDDIIRFDVTHLNGTYLNGGKQLALEYKLYWRNMRIRANFFADVTILSLETKLNGTINLDLNHLEFSGVWTQGISPTHLDDFTIAISSQPEFTIKGLGNLIDSVVSSSVTDLVNAFVNDRAAAALIGLGLQARFNTAWLDDEHKYRIDAIIANCKKSTL